MEDILEREHFSFSLDVVYMAQVFAPLRHFFFGDTHRFLFLVII